MQSARSSTQLSTAGRPKRSRPPRMAAPAGSRASGLPEQHHRIARRRATRQLHGHAVLHLRGPFRQHVVRAVLTRDEERIGALDLEGEAKRGGSIAG